MTGRFLAGALLLLMLGACTAPATPDPRGSASASSTPPFGGFGGPMPTGTNVVLVLTDDLSLNLVPFMPEVKKLAAEGATFANYTVTDSLCCPSRASLLTGKFPHDTGVFTNDAPDGGYFTFRDRGNEKNTFATDFQKAGYRTALYGKYLNRYQAKFKVVPPGWTEWAVGGDAYRNFNYTLNENGVVTKYGNRPQDYMTDVLSGKAQKFITDSVAAKTPFLVEISTYAPHSPYTPAPVDANKFPGLKAPRTPAFDKLPTGAIPYLTWRAPLTTEQKARLDDAFRKRVQSVQSIDRMIAKLRTTLQAGGVADRTLIVFTSDNGFHLGEHRLMAGKQTAYETDIRVPLIMAGPRVPAGKTITPLTQNIDLRSTFNDIAGLPLPEDVNGRSLVPLFDGGTPADWRKASLVEHHGPVLNPGDPDRPEEHAGNPLTYSAIRTLDYTYVEYIDGHKEFYDRRIDPHQMHNVPAKAPAEAPALLRELVNCHRNC